MRHVQGERITFLHIPKTAGNSVILPFAKVFGVERCLTFVSKVTDADFEHKKFIAGHVYLGDVTPRSFLFTFVRDPVRQIASHLMWLDHYNLEEFEDEARMFSSEIQGVFEAVRLVDLSSAKSISAFLASHSMLSAVRITNVQSEMIAFRRGHVEKLSDLDLASRSVAAFARLDFIGITECLRADLVQLFRLLGLPGRPEVRHLNSSPATRRIDVAVPAIRRALEAHVGADLRLYETAWRQRERRLRAA